MNEPDHHEHEHFVSSCDKLLRVIGQYLDEEIDPEMCRRLEAHMGRCDSCRVMVDNLKGTIRLYQDEQVYEMPLDFRRRLHDTLRQRWEQVRGDTRESGDDDSDAPRT